MGTTLNRINIVHIRVDILRIIAVVQQGNLDGHTILFCLQADRVANDRGTVTVDITHKLLQTLFGVEYLRLTKITFLIRTQVGERDSDTSIQISQFTHTLSDDVVLIFCGGEDTTIRPELLACTCLIRIAHNLHIVERLTLLILLLIDMAVTIHLR